MEERRALVTLAIGEFYEKMGAITHPLMKEYSKKIGADFICISEPGIASASGLPSKYEKFQIYDIFPQYDRILFVDTDIVINPDTPDIFDYCPPGAFGAVSEEVYSGSTLEKKVTMEVLGEINWIYPYINSGVMLIPLQFRDIFNYHKPEIKQWATGEFRNKYPSVLNDQPYISYVINREKVEFFELGMKYNHTRAYPDSHKRFRSYFIHYAGSSGHRYGARLTQIYMDTGVAKSKLNRRLSSLVPSYRWLVDRANISFLKYLASK